MEPGTTLLRYRVKESLTDAGLDGVYLADVDTGGEVALKLLPVTNGSPRELEQLRQQAKAIADLQHPNIVPIQTVTELDGAPVAVMPSIRGEAFDLWDPDGDALLDSFLAIAIPLSDALATVHAAGFVHRNLHAGNVFIGRDGEPRIMFFDTDREPGAGEFSGSDGASLRSLHYASPEHVGPGPVDERSDIFSVGVLLYLLATGRLPFVGDTADQIATAIREDEPPKLADLEPGLPRQLERIVRRCLEKEPDRRYQSARDLRAELETLVEEIHVGAASDDIPPEFDTAAVAVAESSVVDEEPAVAVTESSVSDEGPAVAVAESSVSDEGPAAARDREESAEPQRWEARFAGVGARVAAAIRELGPGWLPIMGAVLLGVGLFVAGYLVGGLGGAARPLAASTTTRVTFDAGAELFPRPTPDARALVFAAYRGGNWNLHLQEIGQLASVSLTADSGADDTQPAVSPDGTRIAFRSERDGGGIFVIERAGGETTVPHGFGPARKLSSVGYNPAWSPDAQTLVVAGIGVFDSPNVPRGPSVLSRLNLATGEMRKVPLSVPGAEAPSAPQRGADALQPDWSPGGERIAYWGRDPGSGQADIWTVAANGGEPIAVTDDHPSDWSPSWSPDGRYIYFVSDRSGSSEIWRVPIDESSGHPQAPPEPVTVGTAGGSLHPAFARATGALAFAVGQAVQNVHRIPLDAGRGRVTGPAEAITRDARSAMSPEPSPDGTRVAFATGGDQQEDIWVVDVDGGDLTPLTRDGARDRLPRWAPDGRRVAFLSERGDSASQAGSYQVWTVAPDRDELTRLTDFRARTTLRAAWSPNGSRMSLDVGGGFAPQFTFLIDPRASIDEQVAETLPPLGGQERFEAHAWSPDGSRLAGTIRGGGGVATGIGTYSLSSKEYERITDFGANPVWLRDSRGLLFHAGNGIYFVDRVAKEPRLVFAAAPDVLDPFFSVSADSRWIYVSLRHREADVWMLAPEAGGSH